MAILMLISPDGKDRMLLNTDLVFAYIEKGGQLHAVSHTGHAIQIPQTLEQMATALEDADEGEGDEPN